MYSAFVKLLNMSAASGILIAAVIGLRFLLRKVPKKYICILWALVALRLICPVTISSSLSVFNHVGTYHPDNGQIAYIQYNEKTEKPMGEVPLVGSTISSPDGPTVTYHTPNFYLPTAMGIWVVGMAAMLLYAAVSYFRIHRRTDESIRFRRNIYLCDRIPTPFILGMLRPRIFLPSELSQEQMDSVIAHERAHIARLDHWWKPIGFLLLSIHWFNPLVWIAYGLLCRDIELACDEKVIQNMTASQKQAYSEVLLSCSLPRKFITACPLAFGEVGVKQRIKGILNYRKPSFWVILIAVIACLAVAVGFLTNPERNEDYLIVKGQKTKPTKPQTADFKINMGNTISTATVYAELWQNGVCVESTPLVIPETVKEIHLSMSKEMDGDSLTGYQVQIDTKPSDASLNKTIPLPEETYLLECYSWYGSKDIQLTQDKEILLGAAIFDCGGDGFFLFNFDNEDYGECRDRLQNQECVILIWASFQEKYAEAIVPEETLGKTAGVPSEFLDYLNPVRVEWKDDTTINRSAPEKSMSLEELAASTDSWKIEYNIPDVTGPGTLRRAIKLYYEDGRMLVIRHDSNALCCFNINGDCIARITCEYTGEQMVDMLWDWAMTQGGNGSAYLADLTLSQSAPQGKLTVMMHPTSAVNIDGMGYVCPPNQEEWIEAWNAVTNSRGRISVEANAESYYGLYIHYNDAYLEVHKDSQGLYLRHMGTTDGYSVETSKPLTELLEPVLQEFGHNPVKPSDLIGIQSASLVLDGMQYSIVRGDPKLAQLEAILTSGKPLGYMSACWFTSQLTVTLENGRAYTVSVATDSCGAYLSDGVCYEFPGDNQRLYQLFGLNLSEQNDPQQTLAGFYEPDSSQIVPVADFLPDIYQALAYATKGNFTQKQIYAFSEAFLRYGTLQKLANVQEALQQQGYTLKIWDAYRPVSAQWALWNAYPDPNYVSNPANGASAHCRGNTVDVTLVKLNGEEVPMPSGFDNFTALADRDYSDCTDEAAANAKLLETIMESNGFRGYQKEWWHYTDTDSYPVEDTFEPAPRSWWLPECNEFISLREAPSVQAAVLEKIPVGERFMMLALDEEYAFVNYKGRYGYVLQSYIKQE